MDKLNKYLEEKEKDWESICLRCGACCGAYDDPCEHLKKDNQGLYYCDIYANRLGKRKTVSGDVFWCVPVKEILHTWWPGCHLCSYKKMMAAADKKG